MMTVARPLSADMILIDLSSESCLSAIFSVFVSKNVALLLMTHDETLCRIEFLVSSSASNLKTIGSMAAAKFIGSKNKFVAIDQFF